MAMFKDNLHKRPLAVPLAALPSSQCLSLAMTKEASVLVPHKVKGQQDPHLRLTMEKVTQDKREGLEMDLKTL